MPTMLKQTYSLSEVAALCHVSLQTVIRWNRYHGLKADADGNVDRQTLRTFVERTGQTELSEVV